MSGVESVLLRGTAQYRADGYAIVLAGVAPIMDGELASLRAELVIGRFPSAQTITLGLGEASGLPDGRTLRVDDILVDPDGRGDAVVLTFSGVHS